MIKQSKRAKGLEKRARVQYVCEQESKIVGSKSQRKKRERWLYKVHNNFASYINTVLHKAQRWFDCIDSETGLAGKTQNPDVYKWLCQRDPANKW